MPFKIDYLDDGVYEWSTTPDGAVWTRVEEYTPTFYVGRGHGDDSSLDDAADVLAQFPAVAQVRSEQWRPGFRHDETDVVRVDVTDIDEISRLARWLHEWGKPGEYRCFNVDFSREFRYCLERDRDPTPAHDLSTMRIEGRAYEFDEDELPDLTVNGTAVGRSPEHALPRIDELLDQHDPDVLVVDSAELLAELHALADRVGYDIQLGRRPGFQQLAGASTYTSYGRVGNSPARYNVPGRAIIDRSNTFFYGESNLAGCLDLVEKSRKPLQELAWASIGNVLTAIQIQEALSRGVLVPWRAWRSEKFKSMRQLHDADRGGFTFAPDVGVHDDVHELDFSSLYPNIICTRNISPEKIRCECHREREDVPGLGYSICDEPGYLPEVLQPLIGERDAIKAEIRETTDEDRCAELEDQSAAIKWILVSCFGYQGFNNAKFGRIECHEAINAFAREILLDAKAALEAGGWRVVHGIVDSIWVTPRDGEDQRPLEELAAEITDQVRIRLEYEAAYDWVAFVPRRDSDAGALTKYFGSIASDAAGYKYRGIECRQRNTPEFVADAQRRFIEVFDSHRSPDAVCTAVAQVVQKLETGDVDPQQLAIDSRVSKRLEEYQHSTVNVAALERAHEAGRDVRPGEHVRFVVTDDSKASQERVTLAENATTYDPDYYISLVFRAAESVLSPLGWREAEIRSHVSGVRDASITAFTN